MDLFFLLFSLLTAISRAASPRQIMLTFGNDSNQNKSCLVRDAGFNVQAVQTVPCSLLPPSNLLSAAWAWFPDGRLHAAKNYGFCLKYRPSSISDPLIKSVLVAAECGRQNTSGDDIWAIQNGKLWNNAFKDDLDNSTELLELWKKEDVHVEDFDEEKLISLQRDALKTSMTSTMHRFRQMLQTKDVPDTSRGLAELLAAVDQASAQSKEIDVLTQNISTLTSEIKADLTGHPSHIGQGVLVEILESTNQEPSLSFLAPKFELSTDQLRSSGINPSGPVTVRLSGYVVSPRDGNYRFVATNLMSQFRLSANGVNVINQWSAPAMGSVKSDPALSLTQGEEVQLVATASGLLGIPSFKLLWQHTDAEAPDEIPTAELYPSIVEPLCTAGGLIAKVDCSTTFNKIKVGSEAVKVSCPPGCLAVVPIPKVFGSPACYALHSSVCVAAIHSGVSGERGGSFVVQVDPTISKPSYPSVDGFHVTSSEAPAATGCASVAMTFPGGGPSRLQDAKLVDKKDIMASDGSGLLSGMHGIVTSAEKSLLARRTWASGGFAKHITVSCGSTGYQFNSNEFDDELQLTDGATILLKEATSSNDIGVKDLYVTVDQGTSPPLAPSRDGWNRLSCQTTKNKINLYFKFGTAHEEYQYPSATLTCEDTFESLKSPFQTFSVRCPRFCFKSFAPVYGLFSYSSRSSVCRSAAHAGIIAEAGGTVQVTRLPLVDSVKWKSKRNGIGSETDDTAGPLFALDLPSGTKCIYPEHPGGLSHVSMVLPKFESTASFIQLPHHSDIRRIQQHSHELPTNYSFVQRHKSETLVPLVVLEDTKKGLQRAREGLEQIGKAQDEKAKDAEKSRLAITMLEKLIHQKLEQGESKIQSLEQELATLETESANPYTDFDRTSNIYEDWLVIDSANSQLGPSAWSIGQVKELLGRPAISQKSSISSKTGFGTAAVLKGRSFSKGFVTVRARLTEGGYGTFGVLVKYKNDGEYVALELSKSSAAGAGYVAFRRARDGILEAPEGKIAFDLPAAWIKLGVDFGSQNVRVFIQGGSLKTGIDLGEGVEGGTVGLWSNAMGTDSLISFDSFVAAPLEAQDALAKDYFGSDAERKGTVHVELAAKELDTTTPIEGLPTSRPKLPEEKPAATISSFAQGVEAKTGQDGCLNSYKDPLTTNLAGGWKVPDKAWTISSDASGIKFTTVAVGKLDSKVMYLSRKICQEGIGESASVSLENQNGARSGLVFRALSPSNYFAAMIDLTENGPQVVLVDVQNGSARQFATGTGKKLNPDTWYSLLVEDFGDLIRLSLDNTVILQTKAPISSGEGSMGLIAESGDSSFKDFNFKILME